MVKMDGVLSVFNKVVEWWRFSCKFAGTGSSCAKSATEEHTNLIARELTLYKTALREAAEFANKRIPRDARETNADVAYYEKIFLDVAARKLEDTRSVEQ
jgi:hypothetical protein